MAKIDFSDVPKDDSWVEGRTPFSVMKAESTVTNAGDPMLKTVFKALDGKNTGRQMYSNFTFTHPISLANFKKFIYVTTGKELGADFDTDDLPALCIELSGARFVGAVKNKMNKQKGEMEGAITSYTAYQEQ